uniref:SEA domain-containing protein n=1 Tax=Bursaphelenchus xylophilus TaxID=6326 RepID=A0A1I7S9I7_BURXY
MSIRPCKDNIKKRMNHGEFLQFGENEDWDFPDFNPQYDEPEMDPALELIQKEYVKQLYSAKRPFTNKKSTKELLQILTAFVIAFIVFYGTVTLSYANVITDQRYIEQNLEKRETSSGPEDFICNVDTDFECVCNRSLGNLDDTFMQCNSLIAEEKLSAVEMVVKNVDLKATLHTNETYQDYFRRRVANLVSQHCEQHAHECAGAQLGLTQANVLIMHVEYLPRRRTKLKFVVRKDPDLLPKMITADLIDTRRIVDILSNQVGPLSRVLGGIRIETLRLGELQRQALPADNTKLLIIVGCVLLIIFISYIVAVVKCIMDSRRKRAEAKKNESLAKKDHTNYGACADKLDAPNNINKGTRSSTSSKSSILNNNNGKCRRTSSGKEEKNGRLTARSSTKRSTGDDNSIGICDLQTSQPSSPPPSANTDTRSFQRMFACDMSQLPAESLDDGYSGEVFLEESISQEAIESPNVFYKQQQNNSHNNFYVGSTCNSHQSSHIFNIEGETNSINHNYPSFEAQQLVQRAVPIVVETMGSEPKLNYDENDNHIHDPPPPAPEMQIKNELAEVENEEQSPPPPEHETAEQNKGIEYSEIELPVPAFEVSKTPRGSLDNDKEQEKEERSHEPVKLSTSLLDAITHDGPYERPLSRRGSRDSPHEDGEEELYNERGATPPPIGDRGVPLKIPQLSIDFADDILSKPKRRYADWSSDSEDESNEPYQPLAEEDELELEETMRNNKEDGLNIDEVPERPLSRNCAPRELEDIDYYSSSSESEIEDVQEEDQENTDRPYERLSEVTTPNNIGTPQITLNHNVKYSTLYCYNIDPDLLAAAEKTAAATIALMSQHLQLSPDEDDLR